jgi:hypothetical protein
MSLSLLSAERVPCHRCLEGKDEGIEMPAVKLGWSKMSHFLLLFFKNGIQQKSAVFLYVVFLKGQIWLYKIKCHIDMGYYGTWP